jgi:hypothetical protein
MPATIPTTVAISSSTAVRTVRNGSEGGGDIGEHLQVARPGWGDNPSSHPTLWGSRTRPRHVTSGDHVVTHQRVGGFHDSGLDEVLRGLEVETVAFVGWPPTRPWKARRTSLPIWATASS